ncbi:hypothetical protein [Alcanivorax sp. 1008]|uniref:hypothetical protein n=1 Tax=Alcanivorax sp. 1008 TaxID=2816853 RepID=UPI001DE4551D|nr:hypothetical protein [Alcanivorax sp. 1008]MCC1496830.1 hypothetical protein [Alcanivorax sp. 1008]
MFFSAVIRCLPLDPGYAVDIGVRERGDIASLGLLLADVCSGIVSGTGGLELVQRQTQTQFRYTDTHGLSALLQGMLLPAMESLLEYDAHFSEGALDQKSDSLKNLFVLRAADEISPPAEVLYTVDLRLYPEPFAGVSGDIFRPWIIVHGEGGFSGWPEDILLPLSSPVSEV